MCKNLTLSEQPRLPGPTDEPVSPKGVHSGGFSLTHSPSCSFMVSSTQWVLEYQRIGSMISLRNNANVSLSTISLEVTLTIAPYLGWKSRACHLLLSFPAANKSVSFQNLWQKAFDQSSWCLGISDERHLWCLTCTHLAFLRLWSGKVWVFSPR